MLTREEVQNRAEVRRQIFELYDHLDIELLLLMGGLAPGGDLGAATAAAADATKRTASLVESIGSAYPCK